MGFLSTKPFEARAIVLMGSNSVPGRAQSII